MRTMIPGVRGDVLDVMLLLMGVMGEVSHQSRVRRKVVFGGWRMWIRRVAEVVGGRKMGSRCR